MIAGHEPARQTAVQTHPFRDLYREYVSAWCGDVWISQFIYNLNETVEREDCNLDWTLFFISKVWILQIEALEIQSGSQVDVPKQNSDIMSQSFRESSQSFQLPENISREIVLYLI